MIQSLDWQLELALCRINPLPLVANLLGKNSRSSGVVKQNDFTIFSHERNLLQKGGAFFTKKSR